MLPAHKISLSRTAITCAKLRMSLEGYKKALFTVIYKIRDGKRSTLLGERITLYYGNIN